MSSGCCNCCAFTSMIGVVFFGLTSVMVKRENAVFLSHKAGMNLHTVTEEEINEKFMAMIYTMVTFAVAMLLCLMTACCCKSSEMKKIANAEATKALHAKVAFEQNNEGLDKPAE